MENLGCSEEEYLRRYPEEAGTNGTYIDPFHSESPPQSEDEHGVKLFIGQVLF